MVAELHNYTTVESTTVFPSSGDDLRARRALEERGEVGERADRGPTARPLGEAARCFDLRPHRARREGAPAEGGRGRAADGAGRRAAEAVVGGVDVGREDEHLGREALREQRRGEVLVDD